mgnify:CR=1 FL=1
MENKLFQFDKFYLDNYHSIFYQLGMCLLDMKKHNY